MSNFLHNIASRRNAIGRTLDDKLLGLIGYFSDEKKEALGSRMWYTVTGGHVVCRLVKNSSGGDLIPGRSVKFAAGKDFTEISGYSGAGEVSDGIVDPYTSKTAVPDGKHFLIVISGRVVGAQVSTGTLTVGQLVKTAATGKLVAATAVTDAGFVGKVQVATTTSGDDAEIVMQLRESINVGNMQ